MPGRKLGDAYIEVVADATRIAPGLVRAVDQAMDGMNKSVGRGMDDVQDKVSRPPRQRNWPASPPRSTGSTAGTRPST
jgi:hypothetical protein